MTHPETRRFEVFFDGDCPLCRREIRLLQRLDREQQIRFTDISSISFDETRIGVSKAVLMATIHGRLADGSLVTGVEVFRQLYEAVGFRKTVALTRLPGVRAALDLAYRIFAKNRLRLTGRTECSDDKCAVRA